MKLKPKQKKWMMIAGGSVLAIALTAAIGSQFKRLPKEGDIVLPDREPYQEIILADLPTGADISSVEPETLPNLRMGKNWSSIWTPKIRKFWRMPCRPRQIKRNRSCRRK